MATGQALPDQLTEEIEAKLNEFSKEIGLIEDNENTKCE